MSGHPREKLTAYADGELDPTGAAEIESHLRACTECARELMLLRNLKGAFQMIQPTAEKDLWGGVHRRLTRPAGWLLIAAGVTVWIILAAIRWFQSELTIEWLAATAVATGGVLLLVGIGWEQYHQWRNERYKDVER
jgi:anti-sigma factor RsiW